MTVRAAQLLLVAVILTSCAEGSGTAGQEERLASPEEQAEAQLILNALNQVTIGSYLSPPGAGRLYAYTLTAADESRQEGGSAAVAADRVLRAMLEGNPTAHTALTGYAERRRAADPAASANADLVADRLLQLADDDGADELTGAITPDSVETREERSVDIYALREELGLPPYGLNSSASGLAQQLESDGLLEKILASDDLFSWETTPLLFAKETPRWGELLPLGVERETLETCDLPAPDRARVLDEAFILNTEYDLVDAASPAVSIWLGGRGTITPAGMWVEMAADAAAARDADILAAAAAVARATHNATIVNYREKYRHNLVRPETLWDRLRIGKRLVRDTPPHPSYPSGHSAISAAGAHTISTLFGEDTPLTLRVPGTLGWPDQAIIFDTPAEALADVSGSRVVAGFHYPLDTAAGEKLGHCAAAITAVGVR